MLKMAKITELTHHLVGLIVEQGNVVVDATAGNGYDTLFLAERVGPSGRVYAFDVQKKATAQTYKNLKEQNLQKQVILLRESHEHLSYFVREKVNVIMYNLGYLPGGDQRVTTKHDSTLESLKQALQLLTPGGIISIVLYPGHREGAEEKEKVIPFCKELDPIQYVSLNTCLLNREHNPPELAVIQKRIF